MSNMDGPLGWCAEYTPRTTGCNFKQGECLSTMSAAIGRFLHHNLGTPSEEERTRILANADFLERMATSLRSAVSWVETGHNGHGRDGGDDLFTKGLRRAARAKPDAGGTCNGEFAFSVPPKWSERGSVGKASRKLLVRLS
jgi:hypothetical protein